MITAKWERGFESLYRGVDANAVAEEIMSIGDSATPQQIVDKGRDESTELHKCFTWDDTDAAEKWRKQEARIVVGHLVIQRPKEEEHKPEIRVFLKPHDSDGYQPATMVFRNEDSYLAMLQRALSELRAFQKKYSILSDRAELLNLIDAVNELVESA